MASTVTELLRRRFGGKKDNGYIKDGLVFPLDGINKGTTDTTKWVDLVGGIVFTEKNNVSVHGENCINLTNTTFLVGDSMPTLPFTECTIEGASSPCSGWNFLLLMKRNNVSLYKNSDSRINGGSGSNHKSARFSTTQSKIYSCADGNIIINGVQSLDVTDNNWYGNINLPTINSSNVSTIGYGKTFDLYCIRIYNRLLTIDEMLHNQRIDNERFELGLTI